MIQVRRNRAEWIARTGKYLQRCPQRKRSGAEDCSATLISRPVLHFWKNTLTPKIPDPGKRSLRVITFLHSNDRALAYCLMTLKNKNYMSEDFKISRERMVELLNEDLSREYQAIIAYTIYSQTIKGAAFNNIATELENHASEELNHAILIARQIDYLNGKPTSTPKEVKTSDKAEEMLRFDLENERQTILNYRQRIRQADAMGEFALGEVLRKIIEQEQDHLLDLADALGVDAPNVGD
jgi:bacterioferritin